MVSNITSPLVSTAEPTAVILIRHDMFYSWYHCMQKMYKEPFSIYHDSQQCEGTEFINQIITADLKVESHIPLFSLTSQNNRNGPILPMTLLHFVSHLIPSYNYVHQLWILWSQALKKHDILELNNSINFLNISIEMTLWGKTKALNLTKC